MYRRLSADKIFDGQAWLPEHTILVLNEEGKFIAKEYGEELGNAERYQGILIPGMINAHCHLELSHLKNRMPEHTGLIDFLVNVIKKRATTAQAIQAGIEAGAKEMLENGTIAVVDICNTIDTLSVKKRSPIIWRNLIEVINLFDENLEQKLGFYNEILHQYQLDQGSKIPGYLSPHAPYSVSEATHRAINEATKNSLVSIHNQESCEEDELFKYGTGGFLNFYKSIGVPLPSFVPSHRSSLQTFLPQYKNGQTLLLVHNTFTTEEDILFAKEYAEKTGLNIFYCLCPNANLYIENKLPPVELLLKHNCKIVLGTDSYSSNWQLNIAAEIKTLCDHFPAIPLKTLLKWATWNGAQAIQENNLGSFEAGKIPGVSLLETENGSLKGSSRRII